MTASSNRGDVYSHSAGCMCDSCMIDVSPYGNKSEKIYDGDISKLMGVLA